jgi:hypothetical protein
MAKSRGASSTATVAKNSKFINGILELYKKVDGLE